MAIGAVLARVVAGCGSSTPAPSLATTPRPATKPLTVLGGGTADSAETWLFDKDHTAQQIGATALGGTITVPAESMTLLVVGK